MKKTLLALIAGLLLAAPLSMPAQAADIKVGVIDVQQILQRSSLWKALQSAQEDVQSAEKSLVEMRDGMVKQLQQMQQDVAAGKMTQDQFTTKQREFEDQMRNKVKEAQARLEAKKKQIGEMKDKLEKNVKDTVEKIAGQKGLDMVISKQLVLFGGTDITNDIISALPQS